MNERPSRKNGPLSNQPFKFSCKKWLVVLCLFSLPGFRTWNLDSDLEEFLYVCLCRPLRREELMKQSMMLKTTLIMIFISFSTKSKFASFFIMIIYILISLQFLGRTKLV